MTARIFTINGFSAHAGQDQLLDWLADVRSTSTQVFLVHGEYSAQEHLAGLIREKFGLSVTVPEYLEEILLKPGVPVEEIPPPAGAAPDAGLPPLLADLKRRLDDMGAGMGKLQSLPASRQAEIAELLRQTAASIEKINKSSE